MVAPHTAKKNACSTIIFVHLPHSPSNFTMFFYGASSALCTLPRQLASQLAKNINLCTDFPIKKKETAIAVCNNILIGSLVLTPPNVGGHATYDISTYVAKNVFTDEKVAGSIVELKY